MNINEIMTLLPHRYPFLLVDRVTDITPNKNILAYKNIICVTKFLMILINFTHTIVWQNFVGM